MAAGWGPGREGCEVGGPWAPGGFCPRSRVVASNLFPKARLG